MGKPGARAGNRGETHGSARKNTAPRTPTAAASTAFLFAQAHARETMEGLDSETERLRQQRIAKIKEAFDLFDKEGKGTVIQECAARSSNSHALRLMLRCCGCCCGCQQGD